MMYLFFLLNLVIVTLLLARLRLFRIEGLPRAAVPALFVVKVLAGYLLSNYYLQVYRGGDMHGYMADAETLYHYSFSDRSGFLKTFAGTDDPPPAVAVRLKSWFGSGYHERHHDARTVIRFHTLVRFVSGGNEWVHLLWSNLASLLGYLLLARFFFDRETKDKARPQIVILLPALLPNVLLWSSAVLKEPLLLLAMGGTCYALRRFLLVKSTYGAVLILFFLLLFSLVKSYWLLLLVPALAAYAWSFEKKNVWRYYIFTYAMALVLVSLAGMAEPVYHIPGLLYGEQRNMWRFAVFMHSGSLIHPLPFAPVWSSVVIRTPMAVAWGLFQPFPGSIRGLSYLPSLLENMVLPCMVLMLLFRGRLMHLRGAFPQVWLGLWGGLGIVAVSAFTTPVLGTLIRYRMPGLLLLVMAGLVLLLRSRRLPDS